MLNSWYTRVREEIEAQYGDDWELFADLLAATLPRKQMSTNWKLANDIYNSIKYGSNYHRRDWPKVLKDIGVMSSQIPNVIRALRGEPLSGPKVRAFAANLKGNHDEITVDVWMLKLFDKPSAKAREEVCEYVVRAAEEMGCSPAEMQAEMWEFSVRRAGRESKSYLAAAVKQRQGTFDWEKENV